MRDVPIMLLMEEFVLGMVPKLRLASMKDVPIMLLREESVSDTVHHGQKRLVIMKDVPIMRRKEEYVPNTERRERLAAKKDAPMMYRKVFVSVKKLSKMKPIYIYK